MRLRGNGKGKDDGGREGTGWTGRRSSSGSNHQRPWGYFGDGRRGDRESRGPGDRPHQPVRRRPLDQEAPRMGFGRSMSSVVARKAKPPGARKGRPTWRVSGFRISGVG